MRALSRNRHAAQNHRIAGRAAVVFIHDDARRGDVIDHAALNFDDIASTQVDTVEQRAERSVGRVCRANLIGSGENRGG